MEYHSIKTTPLPKKPAQEPKADPEVALPPLGILSGLSERSLTDLAGYGKCHRVPAETEIMREGEMQDRFYVVVSGEVNITARIGGREVSLNVATSGDCIGELNLLEPGPASATVKVLKDSTLWSMDAEQLRTYLYEHTGGAGALLMGMAHCLSKRIRQANQLIAQNHVPPVETLPQGRERAITASNTPVHLSFFKRLKQSLTGSTATKKVRISTKIKM
jgi:CRP/FNR family cyclic AMP-dependent transcriptional regulator